MWKAILFLAGIAVAPALLNGRQDAETPAPSSAPIPLAIKERLSGLLPKAAEVGATVSGERQFYSSNLYEYIDGAADAFLQDDLVAMVHQEYKTPQADVTVDIYDMGKPLNAFGMYAAERSPSYHFVPIGAEGYVSDFIVNFFQAEYYVKLSGFSDKPNSSPDLDRFAQAVSQKIGVGRSMPEALTLLPPQGLLPHTEKFVNRAPLGHEILSPAIEGSYSLEGSEGAAGKPTTLLISKAPGPAGAVQRVNRLRDYFRPVRQGDTGAGGNRGRLSRNEPIRGRGPGIRERALRDPLHQPAAPSGAISRYRAGSACSSRQWRFLRVFLEVIHDGF